MTTYYVDSAGNDSNAGTAAGSGTAWLTLQKAADTAVAGDLVYLKSDKTYTEQVDFDTNAGTGPLPITFEGYTTTPGDGGKFTVSGSGSRASCLVFNGTGDFVRFKNIILTSPTTQCVLGSTAATVGLSFYNFEWTKGSASPTRGIYAGGYSRFNSILLRRGLVSGFSTAGIATATLGPLRIVGCKIIDNTGHGIETGSYSASINVIDTIIAGNTLNGINISNTASSAAGHFIYGNTIEGNGGDGINIGGTNNALIVVIGNVIANHSGAGDTGLKVGSLTSSSDMNADWNFYYNNTTHRSGSNTTGPNDVTLSADPFTNAAADNWTLNTTSGGGAAVRAAFLNSFDATNIGYRDGGALQHQDAGGGGGSTTFFVPVE